MSEKIVDKDSNCIVEYIYTLGKAGERLKAEETPSGKVTEYKYDNLYRLVSEKTVSGQNITETSYTYDCVGNRLTKTTGKDKTEYKYNNLNQLISENGTVYKYDDNGNLIEKLDENGTRSIYTFNKKNRLTKATISSGQNVSVTEYKYDYAGNRISAQTDGKTTKYIVDTNGVLSQVLYEENGSGSLTTWYTRGIDLISLQKRNTERYYLQDGHGNVRMLTDEAGIVTDTYDYDAFGNITSQTGSTENNYLYCGEQYDSNTGFYYLRERYMNPQTGTFISMDNYPGSIFDPVSLHKYMYANADPVNCSDPTGYFTLMESETVMAIQEVLDSQIVRTSIAMGLINGWLSGCNAVINGGNVAEFQKAFAEGFLSGFLMAFGFGALSAAAETSVIAAQISMAINGGLVGFDLYCAQDAFENGDYASFIFYEFSACFGVYCAGKTDIPNANNSGEVEGVSEAPKELNLESKQIGKKWGKHKTDYPEMKNYNEYKDFSNDIFKNPEKIVYDKVNDEYLYIRGNDLLRVKPNGEFISTYPGVSSSRVTNAIKDGGVLWEQP